VWVPGIVIVAVVELYFDDMSAKIIVVRSNDCAFSLSTVGSVDVDCDVVARNKNLGHDSLRRDERCTEGTD